MSEMVYLPVSRLHPHPDNPRKDLGDLTELAASIKENGVLQNLTVVDDDPTEYESDYTVVIGHRRLAAAQLAGLTELPCVIAEMTPKEQVQTMLLENMQRADLTVYEQAQGFQMMLDLGATVEEIAEKSGFSETTVRRRVKMMELDQAKLKEVSSRQLSLGDFDTLAQIEDIKKRNEVLESIGTRDFDANVSRALIIQAEKNRPLVKAWLERIGAKEIKQKDTWNNKYENLHLPDCGYYIYVSKWGEKGHTPPDKLPAGQIFYVLSSGTLTLYKKREKMKAEQKTPEQIAKEKAIAEAWKDLEQACALAYDLRTQFIDKLKVTAKNRTTVLYGAFFAGLLHAVDYLSADGDPFREVLDFKEGYEPERDKKIIAGLPKITDAELPALVYALFGDNAKPHDIVTSSYHGIFPEYTATARLHLLYEWLHLLGYESSTEEIQLLSGEHPAFHAGEAFAEEAGSE